MNKVFVIIGRELRQRLRRPSFWVLTLLVPVLLAALYALPVLTANHAAKRAVVLVVDESGLFGQGLESTAEVAFQPMADIPHARQAMDGDRKIDAILYVPMRETTIPRDAFLIHRGKAPSLALQSMVDHQLQTLLRNAILMDVYDLSPAVYHSVESTHIRLRTQEAATGRESFVQVKTVVAVVMAVLMVLALLIFGVQIMRSIQEERQSRIQEVVVSSVRPVQLVAAKIIGVALTALVQIVLWILLTVALIKVVECCNPALFEQARQQQSVHQLASKGAEATAQYANPVQLVDEAVRGLTAINIPLVASLFLLFFLLGYMLYGALLAALAAKLDSDTESLQWVLLVASPLLVALVLAPLVVASPSSTLANLLTWLPFTASAAVMLRIPFGLPIWQIVLAAFLLVLFASMALVWASRTYRRHLLSY